MKKNVKDFLADKFIQDSEAQVFVRQEDGTFVEIDQVTHNTKEQIKRSWFMLILNFFAWLFMMVVSSGAGGETHSAQPKHSALGQSRPKK